MASITRETLVNAAPAAIWDAVRDVGALHTRLVPGMVTHVVLEPGDPPVRTVTFADGLQLREIIVASDDAARRLVWTIDGPPVTHHNGALQVFDAGNDTARVVWTADVLPDALAESFGNLMTAGLATMASHLGH